MTEEKSGSDPAPLIEINVADVIGVNIIEPKTGGLTIQGQPAVVVLTPEQRSLLKRVLEKVLTALYAVEVVVEIGPDGTVRVFGRMRTP